MLTPADSCSGGPQRDPCSSQADSARGSISGTLRLAKGAKAGADYAASGDLWLLVVPAFDITACPDDTDTAPPAATAILHCVDLRDDMQVSFRIDGLIPRDEPYLVVPYLDVNVDASNSQAALDACDLVALPTPVIVDKAREVAIAKTIELSMNAGILESSCGLSACQ